MVDHVAHATGAHFATHAQRRHAGELGMWLFLACESLLFTAFFVLYAAYRVRYPEAFAEGVAFNSVVIGSINTGALLVSSFLIARSAPALLAGSLKKTLGLLGGTFALGAVFLTLKGFEYAAHFHEGIVPGGRSHFFVEHATRGLPLFVDLYYLATGTHAAHVAVGMAVIGTFAARVRRGMFGGVTFDREEVAHKLELGALYWHLVDVVWIFLWPLLYLTRGFGGAP